MEKISSIIEAIKQRSRTIPHLTNLTFQTGEVFGWNHSACAITYNPATNDADLYLLHEIGHALLDHRTFHHDIDLLKMERDAWTQARAFGVELQIEIDGDIIEDSLNTYRDWLHNRSLCPNCNATGIQSESHLYRCLACGETWRVNDARSCALRRYHIKKRS